MHKYAARMKIFKNMQPESKMFSCNISSKIFKMFKTVLLWMQDVLHLWIPLCEERLKNICTQAFDRSVWQDTTSKGNRCMIQVWIMSAIKSATKCKYLNTSLSDIRERWQFLCTIPTKTPSFLHSNGNLRYPCMHASGIK